MDAAKYYHAKVAGRVAFGILLVLSLGSCDQLAKLLGITDPFADYRDPSVNFIAASPFSKTDLSVPGYQSPSSWTWAWGGDPDAGSFPYMAFVDTGLAAGPSAPAGLEAGAEVYSLGLANLFPDGDFEGIADQPALMAQGWDWANPPVTMDYPSSVSIHGNSLHASIQQLTDGATKAVTLRFVLSKLSDVSSNAHSYKLQMMSVNTTMGWQWLGSMPNFSDSQTLQTGSSPTELLLRFSGIAASSPGYLAFGSGAQNEAVFDDIRVTRSTVKGDFALRLLLRIGDTAFPLIHGAGWEFSVWIRKPAAVTTLFPDEAGAREPYAARYLTLAMRQLDPLNPDGSFTAAENYFAVPASGEWTRISIRPDPAGAGTLDFDVTRTDPVLELSIKPFKLLEPEVGAVEIASPELHFFL